MNEVQYEIIQYYMHAFTFNVNSTYAIIMYGTKNYYMNRHIY